MLKLPYFSQLDNQENPYGSCNVTSIAMCLWSFGIRGDGSFPQLEDQMYRRCLSNGWSRHEPYGLKALAESYPKIHDNFTPNATLRDIEQALDAGHPCIVHGYFTRTGHILVIKGYNSTSFIVNDPYGEWFENGYDTSRSGEGLEYSKAMILRLCNPEPVPSIWLHRISKG